MGCVDRGGPWASEDSVPHPSPSQVPAVFSAEGRTVSPGFSVVAVEVVSRAEAGRAAVARARSGWCRRGVLRPELGDAMTPPLLSPTELSPASTTRVAALWAGMLADWSCRASTSPFSTRFGRVRGMALCALSARRRFSPPASVAARAKRSWFAGRTSGRAPGCSARGCGSALDRR
jgi:hypothetical protein